MENNKPKRNGKFVAIEGKPFSEHQVSEIKKVAERISRAFPDSNVTTHFEGNTATIKVALAPVIDGKKMGTLFKVKGVGEYMVRVDHAGKDFTGITVKFVNEYGYANDPFYSKDYDSKDEQLEVWIGTPNHRLRPRWKKDFYPWEPTPHFDYAYEISTLYEETVIPALGEFIRTFLRVYPKLDNTVGLLYTECDE